MDGTKKSGGNVTHKILKIASQVVCPYRRDNINQAIRLGKFPDRLELVKINPIPKKGRLCWHIGNYRLIIILSTVSKLFETVMANQSSNSSKVNSKNINCYSQNG